MARICYHAIALMWDSEIQTGSNCPTSTTTYLFKFLILAINLVPILRQLNYQYTTTPWIDYRNCSQGTRPNAFQMQQQMKIDHCTEEPVTISSSGQYCRMCYAKLKHEKNRGRKMSVGMKIMKCEHTRMGCGWCKQPVCAECWSDYDHNH